MHLFYRFLPPKVSVGFLLSVSIFENFWGHNCPCPGPKRGQNVCFSASGKTLQQGEMIWTLEQRLDCSSMQAKHSCTEKKLGMDTTDPQNRSE